MDKKLFNHFETILNLLSDSCVITDKDGNHVFVSDKHLKFTGLSGELFRSKTAQALQSEGYVKVALNPLVIKSGTSSRVVTTFNNGITATLTGYPIFGEDGKPEYCITFVHDNTDLAELQKKIQEQQALLKVFNNISRDKDVHFSINTVNGTFSKIFEKIGKTALSDLTITLIGETGTGKSSLARYIHMMSSRSDNVFIKMDCSCFTENLIETELFGYTAGTFTGGSSKGKIGLIEAASGGTLFLDEIGEMPVHLQAKLLRVIEDKEIMPVGSTKSKKIDVRFIVATNRNLEECVNNGTFRMDLYYRLKISMFTIPPLRERKEDIILLVNHFLSLYNEKYNRNISFTDEAYGRIIKYNWPGNIRELENMILGLVVGSKTDCVDSNDLPFAISRTDDEKIIGIPADEIQKFTLKQLKEKFENKVIKFLRQGTKSTEDLCIKLGIDRATLFRKLKKGNE